MPSPVGHALAGAATVFAADIATRTRSSPRFVTLCAGLAALPDADLLIPGTHRTFSHSVTAVAVTFIVAMVVTGQVTRLRAQRFGGQAAAVCALAYASHLLLDWLAVDTYPPFGIELLWPWSDRWFISGADIFRQTARMHIFTAPIIRQNAVAIAQEIAILAPIVFVLWSVRVKAATRLAPEVTGRHHPPE
jgi:membrane-bound metal-dependent hydrolase YbcI (DUF457 family)